MSDNLYFLRSNLVAARRIADELMVMSARDSSLFSLNETAALLWDAADGQTPLRDIVATRICSAFDIDLDTACTDAAQVLEQLVQHGIMATSITPFTQEGSAS
jgi:hypothetical protein